MKQQKSRAATGYDKKSRQSNSRQSAVSLGKPALNVQRWLLPLGFLLLTFLVYLPVFSNDFIYTWDDNTNITDNLIIRSLSWESVRQMFSTQVGSAYIPLPLLSLALEYQVFGLSPVVVHFNNLLLHLFCTLLVFLLLQKLGLKPLFAAAGALIFGVHPMGVESVAWASERKDMLYALFYLSAILAYLEYLQKPAHAWRYLALSLVLFILALFSKIQAVSLPLVLLAIDFYKNRALKPKLLIEKIPFLLLSLVFGLAGIVFLKQTGAFRINELYTLQERIFFGTYAYGVYLVKFLAPVNLSALYPYPVKPGETLPMLHYLSPFLLAAMAFGAWRSLRYGRAITFGLLFFTLSVLFLLQIFGAGQGYLADRFTKVPYVGLIFIMAALGQQYLEKRDGHKILIFTIFSVLVVLFMYLSFERVKVWKNGETLWTNVIEQYPNQDARSYGCRALYYKSNNQPEKSLADLSSCLHINPEIVEMLQYRGNLYFNKGREDSAYADYTRALRFSQDNPLTLANLGAIYFRRNQHDSALLLLTRSLQLDTAYPSAMANRAMVYRALGRPDEAIADFKRYLRTTPGDERGYFTVGTLYFDQGEFSESIPWFTKAIALKPTLANYHWMRSRANRLAGNPANARTDALRAQQLGYQLPPGYLETLP